MPQLPNMRQERYAQALARGLTRHKAYLEAGYRGNRGCASRLARTPEVKARVETLLARMAPGAGVDLAEVVDDLMRLARRSEAMDCPAGFAGARAALLAAVKINDLIPPQYDEDDFTDTEGNKIELDMPTDRWLAKHGHLLTPGN
jgi:hypothetical protein